MIYKNPQDKNEKRLIDFVIFVLAEYKMLCYSRFLANGQELGLNRQGVNINP